MISTNLPHVSAPECHHQGFFQIEGIEVQQANLGMKFTHCNTI